MNPHQQRQCNEHSEHESQLEYLVAMLADAAEVRLQLEDEVVYLQGLLFSDDSYASSEYVRNNLCGSSDSPTTDEATASSFDPPRYAELDGEDVIVVQPHSPVDNLKDVLFNG